MSRIPSIPDTASPPASRALNSENQKRFGTFKSHIIGCSRQIPHSWLRLATYGVLCHHTSDRDSYHHLEPQTCLLCLSRLVLWEWQTPAFLTPVKTRGKPLLLQKFHDSSQTVHVKNVEERRRSVTCKSQSVHCVQGSESHVFIQHVELLQGKGNADRPCPT